MPIAFRLDKYTDFAFSDVRVGAVAAAAGRSRLPINFFLDSKQVKAARDAITDMGPWDSFVDHVFHGGNKSKALDAIATLVLSTEAAKWKADSPYDRELPVGLEESDRQAAIGRLLQASSATGRAALLANPVVSGTNVEFAPIYGDGHGSSDPFFRLTMPATMAVTWLEKQGPEFCTPDIYKAAAIQIRGEADRQIAMNQFGETAQLFKDQVHCLEKANLPADAKRAQAHRALALDRHGEFHLHGVHRDGGYEFLLAADIFRSEAEVWEAAGKARRRDKALHRSAAPYSEYAKQCKLSGNFELAADAYGAAAKGYAAGGSSPQAVASWKKAAKCFSKEAGSINYRTHHGITDRHKVATLRRNCAYAWYKAGSPGQAAKAYRAAARLAEGEYPKLARECANAAKAMEDKAAGAGQYRS